MTVIGVMPCEFYFPSRQTELWSPLALDPANALAERITSASSRG
jgi:hypothetical protein